MFLHRITDFDEGYGSIRQKFNDKVFTLNNGPWSDKRINNLTSDTLETINLSEDQINVIMTFGK